jgi:uncharacterized protein YndB with AHSA1/START domain
MRAITAHAVVGAPPDAVFELLSDLREHWLLADHWTDVRRIDADGGTIRLRGPLGLRRTVHVRVTGREPPSQLDGMAVLGRRTAARVCWELRPEGAAGTRVALAAEVLRTGPLDRFLLAVGARRWLAWRFAVTLRRLDGRMQATQNPMSECVTPGTFPPSVRGEDPGERNHRRNRLLWPREP